MCEDKGRVKHLKDKNELFKRIKEKIVKIYKTKKLLYVSLSTTHPNLEIFCKFKSVIVIYNK